MAYNPISGFTLQVITSTGQVASDYYLKFYEANTTTPLSMATDSSGTTLLTKAKISDKGMPVSNPLDNSTVFIPHVNASYRLVIYTSEADADANNTAEAYINVPFVSTLLGASGVGTAAYLDTGTAADQVPTNGDLPTFGTAAQADTGTDFDQVPLNANIVYPVATIADLRLLEPEFNGQQVSLSSYHDLPAPMIPLGGGFFTAKFGDYSSEVSLDPLTGVYVAFPSDPTGVSGAWVRDTSDFVNADWFSSDLDDLSAFTSRAILLSGIAYTGSAATVNDSDLSLLAAGRATVNGLPLYKTRSLGAITPPSGFSWSPPLLINEKAGVYSASIDLARYDKARVGSDVITYYVDVKTGSNANDGLSESTPKRSIGVGAIAAANSAGIGNAVIIVKPGIYSRVDGWGGYTFNGNLTVICEEGAILTAAERFSALTWISEGSGTWSAARTGVKVKYGVTDLAILNQEGKPTHYTPVADVATVKATPGSYFTDGTTVYVHTEDSRVPDTELLINLAIENGRSANGDFALYVKNGIFIGGDAGAFRTGAGAGATAVFDCCSFSGTSALSGLVSKDTGLTISYKCEAFENYLDGFNYHDYAPVGAKAIEIGCKAWKNGGQKKSGDSENSNGSSAHASIKIVRVNTLAWENFGPNIVDVGNCESWNVGCKAWDSVATGVAQKADFEFVDSAVSAWLQGCEGGLTGIQVFKNSGSTVKVKDWSGGLVVYGVLETF